MFHTLRLTSASIVNNAAITIMLQKEQISEIPENSGYLPSHLRNAPRSENGKTLEPRFKQVEGVVVMNSKPVVPGSSYRGSFRDNAVMHILELLPDLMLDYRSLNINAKGGVMSKGAEAVSLEERLAIRARNPIIGLFGGCDPSFIGGSLSVGMMKPTFEADGKAAPFEFLSIPTVRQDVLDRRPELAVRVTDLDSRAEERMLLGKLADLNARMEGEERDIKKRYHAAANDDEKKEIGLELNAVRDQYGEEMKPLLKTLNEKGLNDVDPRQLHSVFALPEGLTFKHKMTVNRGSDDEVGLFLVAMQAFRGHARIGGRSNSSCGGDLEFCYDIEYWDTAAREWVSDGTTDKPGKRSAGLMDRFLVRLNASEYDFSFAPKPARTMKESKGKKAAATAAAEPAVEAAPVEEKLVERVVAVAKKVGRPRKVKVD